MTEMTREEFAKKVEEMYLGNSLDQLATRKLRLIVYLVVAFVIYFLLEYTLAWIGVNASISQAVGLGAAVFFVFALSEFFHDPDQMYKDRTRHGVVTLVRTTTFKMSEVEEILARHAESRKRRVSWYRDAVAYHSLVWNKIPVCWTGRR